MALVEVTRTYLELRDARELRPGGPLPAGATIAPEACRTGTYRALYAGVGGPHHWHDRDAWSDERLAEYLARPDVAVWVLRVGGSLAGYFELVGGAGGVEIAYFGLMPAYTGRGLGRALLARAAEEAFRLGAERVWLHTCTLDHPAALPNYLARGFRPYRTERYVADLKDA